MVEPTAWPRIDAETRDDGTGIYVMEGQRTLIHAADAAAASRQIIDMAADTAAQINRGVTVHATHGGATVELAVYPDKTTRQISTGPATPSPVLREKPAPAAPAAPVPASPQPSTAPQYLAPSTAPSPVTAPTPRTYGAPPPAAPPTGAPQVVLSRREARTSFLQAERAERAATQGIRGLLARSGIRVSPSSRERTERTYETIVSQHWAGHPRTIAVVNGKGGAGKTPVAINLSSTFARYGGAGVLAWDNNQTRGTLGWRTEQGPHDKTLLDLLPEVERLLGPHAKASDLTAFVHHQTRDKFDVLRSKPIALAQDQRITPDDVDALHRVASKFYRLIVMDSGNDESDPMYRRMIHHTDQLVVATSTRADHAEAGALLLEELTRQGGRAEHLARQAVVIVSKSDPRASAKDIAAIVHGYEDLARVVVEIPFDPALVDGQIIVENLRPATRAAWLEATAAVATGLGDPRP
ncbi:AAA family ATPase [Pseudoclavibacter sp. RFBA6]|uniref:MinD/ParA family ATP-binding protein n=1 Tax=Pseudoclavibacter sp. RFBA6 TaxID=2080573 RepID=UPI000CE92AC4|nr:AAA family ATPase [Pseudoclavibacter sp. RFBA6]PPG43742.1 ATPase [Pseudoclavibacter sp. RFBA6]